MKKYILFAFVAVAFILSGCSQEIDHPIAGHSYFHYAGKRYDGLLSSYFFWRDGTCSYTIYLMNGDEGAKYEHFVWNYEKEYIIIKHDNSTFWKKEVRGTEEDRLIYNQSDNTLTSTKNSDIYYGK